MKRLHKLNDEIMQAVRMGMDQSAGALERWEEKFGNAPLCEVTLEILKRAKKAPSPLTKKKRG